MKYVPSQPVTKSKLLLGEGVEEFMFFTALLAHLGVNDVQVDHFGGKTRIHEGIRSIVKRSGFTENVKSLALVRDADYLADGNGDQSAVATAAFDSVRDALQQAALPTPASLAEAAEGPPRVSIYVMPDGARPGMLEDLCLAAVPSMELDCVDSYLKCVFEKTGRQQKLVNLAKSRSHIWLAGQEPPDLRLGEAAASPFWDWERQEFDAVKSWVLSI